jgi:hypothetical protein
MGTDQKHVQGGGHFEAMFSHTLLPRCRYCHAPHPRARAGQPLDPWTCPDCGTPAGQPGPTYFQRGQLTGGPMVFIATALLLIGELIARLAKRIAG